MCGRSERARGNLAIRQLGADDLDFALALTWAEGWCYTRGELERMLKLDPQGSFLYEEDKPLGFITCVTYGRTGVVGHLVVSKAVRGRRIGHSLISKAIDYMSGKGADSMLLYATEDGAKLYLKHGFRVLREVSCIHVDNKPKPAQDPMRRCSKVLRKDLGQIIAMDASLFGDDRSRLIELLYDEFPQHAFKIEEGGRVTGFCFARITDTGFDLGPWSCVSGSRADADSLFRAVLSSIGKGTVYLGIFPENRDAVELVGALPVVRHWRTQLMTRGAERFGTGVEKVYGLAAFELG